MELGEYDFYGCKGIRGGRLRSTIRSYPKGISITMSSNSLLLELEIVLANRTDY